MTVLACWEHKIVLNIKKLKQKQFCVPVLQTFSNLGKFSEINKQFNVKSWLAYQSYSSVWLTLSCKEGQIMPTTFAPPSFQTFLRPWTSKSFITTPSFHLANFQVHSRRFFNSSIHHIFLLGTPQSCEIKKIINIWFPSYTLGLIFIRI